MENVSAERSAGWSALSYVAVLVLASMLTNGMPSLGSAPIAVALAIDAHRVGLLCGAWLAFPAAAFFLWFLVGLRSYLINAPGRQEGLPTFALISGAVMTAMSLMTAGLLTTALYASPDTFKAHAIGGVYDAFFFMQGGLGYAPVAIFLFAAAHSMRRHDRAPMWLAWLGYLAALGAAFATLSIFVSDGAMAPGQPGPGLLGAIPAAVWLVATGLVLILQNRRKSESPASTSAAS